MVKALTFKGDKKLSKKRKHAKIEDEDTPKDTTAGDLDDDDSWVSAESATDPSGPVMIVLPTDPPTCLACDVNGTVFSCDIENLVDGNPTTAEPHEIRQVWQANRIAGTDSVSLKGHHGK
jgi:protein FRG1